MSLFDTNLVDKPMYYFDEPGTHRFIVDMASEIEKYLKMYESDIPSREKFDPLFFLNHFIQVGNIIRSVYTRFAEARIIESYNPDIGWLGYYRNELGPQPGVTPSDPNLYLTTDGRLLFEFEIYMNSGIPGKRRRVVFEISRDFKHVYINEAKII